MTRSLLLWYIFYSNLIQYCTSGQIAPQVKFVVIEKYQALNDPNDPNNNGEAKEIAAAKQIRALRPDQTVIFYFAVDYARTWSIFISMFQYMLYIVLIVLHCIDYFYICDVFTIYYVIRYSLGHWFDANPQLEAHNADGSLATVTSEGFTWHIFDFAQPAARQAWVEALVKAVGSGLVDGVFVVRFFLFFFFFFFFLTNYDLILKRNTTLFYFIFFTGWLS